MGDAVPCCGPENSKKIYANIDLRKVSAVGDVSLGDDVEITIKGKIVGLRGPDESLYTTDKNKVKKDVYPGNVRVEVTSLQIDNVGEFEPMMED